MVSAAKPSVFELRRSPAKHLEAMIRRSFTDGRGNVSWQLISQVQHARLAGALAEPWNLEDVPAHVRAELRWVATHHDDGWAPWEAQPSLDTEGRPRDFLDMPVAEINPIWARSIQRACEHSPLAGRLVAEHFLRLRAGSSSEEDALALRFTRQYQSLSDECWRRTQAEYGAACHADTINQAQEYLRLFDVLSLTLCCAPPSDSVTFPLPSGESLVCQPLNPWRFRLSPWLIAWPSLSLQLDAQHVPARRYASVKELKQIARPCRLSWTLTA